MRVPSRYGSRRRRDRRPPASTRFRPAAHARTIGCSRSARPKLCAQGASGSNAVPPKTQPRAACAGRNAATEGGASARPRARGARRAGGTLGDQRGLWLELAPGAALGPGGLTPAVDAWTSIRFDRSTWSAGAMLLVPITDRRLGAAEGSAQLSLFMTGAFADVALLRGSVQVNAGGGVGTAISRMKGTARAGYESADDTVWVAAPFARASAHVEMGYGWRLTAGAMFGTALPQNLRLFRRPRGRDLGQALLLRRNAGRRGSFAHLGQVAPLRSRR